MQCDILLSFPTRRSSDLFLLEHAHELAGLVRARRDFVPQSGVKVRNNGKISFLSIAFCDILHVIVEAPPLLDHNDRSEEHTSELQSPYDLVCRFLLETKK